MKKLLFSVSIIFIILVGCSKENGLQITKEEKQWLHKFFSDIFLEENGIFVLFGSKPMISADLYMMEEEEAKELANLYSEEERKNTLIIEYDLNENWKKWEEIRKKFPIKKYLFFSQEYGDDPRFQKVYLVDILKCAQVIRKHYNTFRDILGFDFDPFQVVYNIQEREDPFWKRVLHQEAVLFGILLGYGEENAWAFSWRTHHSNRYFFPGRLSNFVDGVKNYRLTYSGKPVSRRHFPIPIFYSFSEKGKDKVIKRYEREREEIKSILSKGDFVEIIANQLCTE